MWNHTQICSWKKTVLSNKGKVSCSRKQTSTLRVRRASHCAMPPLKLYELLVSVCSCICLILQILPEYRKPLGIISSCRLCRIVLLVSVCTLFQNFVVTNLTLSQNTSLTEMTTGDLWLKQNPNAMFADWCYYTIFYDVRNVFKTVFLLCYIRSPPVNPRVGIILCNLISVLQLTLSFWKHCNYMYLSTKQPFIPTIPCFLNLKIMFET